MTTRDYCQYRACTSKADTERTITLGAWLDELTFVAPEARAHSLVFCTRHARLVDSAVASTTHDISIEAHQRGEPDV